MVPQPLVVYVNWASYDELSDAVELTERLALAQLEHLLRLREAGCQFDAYVMDCFWYRRDGGYRAWRRPQFPRGGDRWLARCREAGVLPGLWFGGNCVGDFMGLAPLPEWENSLNAERTACCLFAGDFWPHFLETLAQHYATGVRVFKFDFWQLQAVTPADEVRLLPSEIRARNLAALRDGFAVFRRERPDAVFLGYNGLEETVAGRSHQSGTAFPVRRTIDPALLEVFDAIYCGDPRPADVPCAHFWRSKDIYSDHMVRAYHEAGLPLAAIDNSGPMIGTTGTCYFRGTAAWRGMALLGLMRGGWVNTFYGNLELLDTDAAAWLARAQRLVLPLQETARWSVFGGLPGRGEPYGFRAATTAGSLAVIVNPAQTVAAVPLPRAQRQRHGDDVRVLFRDAGFAPTVRDGALLLGPEQLALVGTGEFADPAHDLGFEPDVVVPTAIKPLLARPEQAAGRSATLHVPVPAGGGRLRAILRQYSKNGYPHRTTGGAPPNGTLLGELIAVRAELASRPLPVRIDYDKKIWSGLSWAVGEIDLAGLPPGETIRLTGRTTDEQVERVTLEVYHALD